MDLRLAGSLRAVCNAFEFIIALMCKCRECLVVNIKLRVNPG